MCFGRTVISAIDRHSCNRGLNSDQGKSYTYIYIYICFNMLFTLHNYHVFFYVNIKEMTL